MKVCPRCRGSNYSSTYVGHVGRDENDVGCECGWTGKGHELVETNQIKWTCCGGIDLYMNESCSVCGESYDD